MTLLFSVFIYVILWAPVINLRCCSVLRFVDRQIVELVWSASRAQDMLPPMTSFFAELTPYLAYDPVTLSEHHL